jgi:glycosyltransferase involved in cell wall biosynthesis
VSRILYLQYFDPAGFPPLEHSSRILADAGWDVRFLGVQTFGNSMLGAEGFSFPEHPRVSVRLLPAYEPGLGQRIHYVRFAAAALKEVLTWRPEWVYLSDSMSALAGLLVSRVPGLRVLYHEHDSPAQQRSYVQKARLAMARKADTVVIPNQGRAEAFVREVEPEGDVHVVWNCPRVDEVKDRPEDGEHPLRLIYHGCIAPKYVPFTILRAMARFPGKVELLVVGFEPLGSRGHGAELLRAAAELGIEDLVRVHGAVSRARLLEFCRTMDAGLSLTPGASDDINLVSRVGASNKIFDYLASGVAGLVTDLPDWAAEFVAPGYARAVNQESEYSLATVIEWMIGHRAEVARMGELGRRRILSEWNYQHQFAPVLRRLEGGGNGEAVSARAAAPNARGRADVAAAAS